jgi:hemin uptake protein HemP
MGIILIMIYNTTAKAKAMSDKLQFQAAGDAAVRVAPPAPGPAPLRISSRELIKDGKGVEIDHEGRIYKLRITNLGKLILTA